MNNLQTAFLKYCIMHYIHIYIYTYSNIEYISYIHICIFKNKEYKNVYNTLLLLL